MEPILILVTGGTGFVGRALVRDLVGANHTVRVLSRIAYPSGDRRISVFRGDITSRSDLQQAVEGCTSVFHCAAEKKNASRMTAVNVSATQLLVNLAADSHVTFFCHLSSVGTTGLTEQKVVDESTPCNPTNHYEETKLRAEEIVSEGLPNGRVVVLRPTNIFGAETLSAWLGNSVSARVRRFLIGNENAHLVYVKDVVAAATFLFRRLSGGVSLETYIVSSDEDHGNTYRAVQARLASKIDGAPRPPLISAPVFIPHWARRIRNRRANRGDVVYSSRKLRDSGFRFAYGLDAGLADALEVLSRVPRGR